MPSPIDPPQDEDRVIADALNAAGLLRINRHRGIVELGIKNGTVDDQVPDFVWVHINVDDLIDALGSLEVI